jgi:hypothetical protein
VLGVGLTASPSKNPVARISKKKMSSKECYGTQRAYVKDDDD